MNTFIDQPGRPLVEAEEVRRLPKNALYIGRTELNLLPFRAEPPTPISPEDYAGVRIFEPAVLYPILGAYAKMGGRYDYDVKLGERRAKIVGLEDDIDNPQVTLYTPITTIRDGVPYMAWGQRAATGDGESRLLGRIQGGFGGHVDMLDVNTAGITDADRQACIIDTLRLSQARELVEELGLSSDSYTRTDQGVGAFIMDHSDEQLAHGPTPDGIQRVPVSSVHLALVNPIFVPENNLQNIKLNQEEVAVLEFVPVDEYIATLERRHAEGYVVEAWTWILGHYMLEPIKDFITAQNQ